MIITHIFTQKHFKYKTEDVIFYNVSRRHNIRYSYTLLQFVTKDEITHSVVSFELTNFNEIVEYFIQNKTDNREISIWKSLKSEYGLAFILSLAIILVLLLGLFISFHL